VDAHPEGLVVNLGAGLDTRFYRLDNGTITWIDIDLPEVVAFSPEPIRRRLTPDLIRKAAKIVRVRFE
jgi:O-methyltransferase involved in polyketide biosynthesis